LNFSDFHPRLFLNQARKFTTENT